MSSLLFLKLFLLSLAVLSRQFYLNANGEFKFSTIMHISRRFSENYPRSIIFTDFNKYYLVNHVWMGRWTSYFSIIQIEAQQVALF